MHVYGEGSILSVDSLRNELEMMLCMYCLDSLVKSKQKGV